MTRFDLSIGPSVDVVNPAGEQFDPAQRKMAPVLVTDVTADMRLMQEEIFGLAGFVAVAAGCICRTTGINLIETAGGAKQKTDEWLLKERLVSYRLDPSPCIFRCFIKKSFLHCGSFGNNRSEEVFEKAATLCLTPIKKIIWHSDVD